MEKGIKVVISADSSGHSFEEGTIAISLGEQHSSKAYRDWWRFESEETGFTQWLKPEHYVLLQEESSAGAGKATAEVVELKGAELSKTKMVYVVYEGDEFVYATPDREDARGLKADLGGKRDGIKIMAYSLAKEIR
jgi:hypothetical protein